MRDGLFFSGKRFRLSPPAGVGAGRYRYGLFLATREKSGEGGFSMLEVLVAILVITFFLAGTLQLMAIDTLYKLLTKQQANAAQWIQEDVEEIRALAATLPRNDGLCNPATITTTNNYASVLQTTIDATTTLPGATSKPLLSPNSKPYRMTRTYQAPTTDQPSVLKITYSVADTNSADSTNQDINRNANSVIARFYTEVIPAASFQCP